MEKIKIIEEGRLSILEQSQIIGGTLDCFKDTYRTQDCPGAGGDGQYAYCPVSYYSCDASGYVICNAANHKYLGPKGPCGVKQDILVQW